MRLSPRERWIGFIATAVASLYVWFTLQPDLLLSNTTTNGGDTGAHVWWPAFLRDHILPKWRLTGWAPDWYAGFPAGVFYFPLPSLLIVLLDVFLPYNVAFKLVTALGPIMLPIAAYFFAKGLGARWPGPPLFAVATLPFLFYTGYTIWGGNLASTLAGEFSFTIALALGLFFLGALARALDGRKGLALPAALLAATVMSHLIVAVFVAVGAIVLWLQRRPLRNLPVALSVAAVAFCLTAIWSVPLVLRLGYTTDMGWTKEKAWDHQHHLLPNDLRWAFGLAALGAIVGLVLRRRASITLLSMSVVFAVAFVVIPEARLWNARLLPFYYLTVLFLAACGVAELAILLARAAPGIGWALWRAVSTPEPEPAELSAVDASMEPVFGPPVPTPPPPAPPPHDPLPVHPAVQAVLGPPEPRPFPREHRPPAASRWSAVCSWLVPALVVAVALVGARQYTMKTRAFLPAWIRWNYSGYEAKPAYAEFREVITTMDSLPPGRALWEPSSGIDKYGTTLALELLPHFTNGRIGSMEGLYFESAATTPYHFMTVSALAKQPSNPVRGLHYRSLGRCGQPGSSADDCFDFNLGVDQMRLMGVRYFMAQSDEAKAAAATNPRLKPVAETGSASVAPQVARWKIYEVLDSPLVEPLRNEPVVIQGLSHKHWLAPAADWFDDEQALDRPLVDGGPQEWVRAGEKEARFQPKKAVPKAVTVSNIETGDDTVSFDVSEPGVPVLVKTSYFPNWGVTGAKGPWRASPNLMVVVPTGTHVELHYGRTGVDWAGLLLTAFGLVALAALAGWKLEPLPPRPPWRKRSEDAAAPPTPLSEGPQPHSEEEPAPLLT